MGGIKPLDFGGGGINGSLDARGRFIAINFYHPEHGYVTLTSAPPFPDEERYNPAAVRAYRASLPRLEGFGVEVDEAISMHWGDRRGVPIHVRNDDRGQEVIGTTEIFQQAVIQIWIWLTTPVTFTGEYRLMRCAYTQLTEGGVIPMPPTETTTNRDGDLLIIENPAIGAVAISGIPFDAAPHKQVILRIAFALTRDEAVAQVRPVLDPVTFLYEFFDTFDTIPAWRKMLPDDPLIRRGIEYSQRMAIPVGEGVCFLTDHMLLPLSWNRDAYYLARALMWHADFDDTIRRHLIWMFEMADRIDGAWGRCYLANGRVKDPAFQLDQQLFPLLELAEYVDETGDQATWERLKPRAAEVLDMLIRRKHPDSPLFPTDETPADDPIALPYHLSSHILFWAALNKLNRLGFGQAELAKSIRKAIPRYFMSIYDGKSLYAYATDGRGGFHYYHDANDFPTVLAPLWGFCTVVDPVWRATVDFAFSEANREGIYAGRLGSVHTRAPWSLGDVQDLIVARLLGDKDREAKAKAQLEFAAQQDGALPEAYDTQTGEVVSRTWFAWTNAAYACAELGMFRA